MISASETMIYHDDWLVCVCFWGHVYCFQTEMWPEHEHEGGSQDERARDWRKVEETALARAEWSWNRGDKGLAIDARLLPINDVPDLRAAVNAMTEDMSDADFRRFVRR